MTTLLPSSARSVRSFDEWIEYVRFRLGQATRLDSWRGLPPVAFGTGSRREQLLLRLALACAATALVAAFLLPWRFSATLAAASALLGIGAATAMRSVRRNEIERRGESDVALGALVLANQRMFDPDDPADLPGVLVVTRDEKLMHEPDVLIALSFRLFGLRHKEPAHVPEELRAIADRLSSDNFWFEPLPVPRAWAGNDGPRSSRAGSSAATCPIPRSSAASSRCSRTASCSLTRSSCCRRRCGGATTSTPRSPSSSARPRRRPAGRRRRRRGGVRVNAIELRPAASTRVWRIGLSLGAFVLAAMVWKEAGQRADLAASRSRLALAAALALLLLVWACAGWRSRFVLGADGVEQRSAFATRHLDWSEIDGVVHGYFRCTVIGVHDGRPLELRFVAGRDQERAILGEVLARAPKLAAIAWGLGLGSVERPRGRPALLPERLELYESGLVVRGPGRSLLRIAADRADYARVVECARERLARTMLGEEVPVERARRRRRDRHRR